MRIVRFILALSLALAPAAVSAAPRVLSPAQMMAALGSHLVAKGDARSDEIVDREKAAGERAGEQSKSRTDAQRGNEWKAAAPQMAKGLAWGKLGIDAALKASDFANAYKPLSPDDSSLGNVSPAGMPRIPSKCVEGTGCAGCYEKAYGDLNHLRFSFAKLGAVGKWTDNFTKKSIAFGDSVSGIHGVAGIAWQAERSKIEASYRSFGTAYDSKYEELIGDLEGALREISVCEAKHFDSPDWYDRYGFIYYSFMADRYRR